MELRHLRYFVAVAEELHFGRAAARLNIAQPPLSQQILRLEEEMNVSLFHRSKRRVQLTAAGAAFYEHARAVLDHAERAANIARRAGLGEIGQLRLGYVSSAVLNTLAEILRRYHRAYERVGVEMTQMTTSGQLQAVADGRLHVGFISPAGRQSSLVIGNRKLRIHTVLREPLMVALPSSHPLVEQDVIALRSLAGEKFVVGPRSAGAGYRDRIVSLCYEAGFEPEIGFEASPSPTMLTFVAAELGVALVPRCAARFSVDGIVLRPLRELAEIELAAVWWADNPEPVLPPFVALIRSHAAGQGAAAPGMRPA